MEPLTPGKSLVIGSVIPGGLVAYGMASGRKGFLWFGGVWLALNVLWYLVRTPTKVAASMSPATTTNTAA